MWKLLKGSRGFVLRSLTRQYSRSAISTTEYKREMQTFQGVYPGIIDTLKKNPALAHNTETMEWLKRIFEYNLKGGKKVRAMTTLSAYKTLQTPAGMTDESLHLIQVLGWCVEMIQAFFLMADDILDRSSTRRGQPCWYLIPEVGTQTVNDCSLLLGAVYEILKEYCEKLPLYNSIVHLINESIFYTSIGQNLDYTMARRNDYTLYTLERYTNIVTYKTAYYTFKLPVFLGLYLASDVPQHSHKMSEQICLALGFLFQMQDDYIDCFASEETRGKLGSDIQEGKCTWLAVQALKMSNPAQRATFLANYGRHEKDQVDAVELLYKELDLPALYYREVEKCKKTILDISQQLDIRTNALFENLLDDVLKHHQNRPQSS
ncbi:unnamed protein product [Pieris brassicae]|uniref:Farnesyl pyrophosphate synthase n=1 Tax=Pieris brassicae TaxID=7116 RepID=A0A9P0XGW2_PIEBR|nr:unnamed protein product [Pieris brassicae]